MNKSHLVHGLIALVMSLAVGFSTDNWFHALFLVFGIFWSREHSQAQMHIASDTGRKLKDVKWHEGGDMTKWSSDALLDFFVPMIVSSVVTIIAITQIG